METNAPMYTVTPDGAAFIDVMRMFLDSEMITVGEYEQQLIKARLTFRPDSHGKSCDVCCAIAAWRYLDVPRARAGREEGNWGHLCPSCASREMTARYRGTTGSPWVMEPVGDGVYEPDITIVMMAQLR